MLVKYFTLYQVILNYRSKVVETLPQGHASLPRGHASLLCNPSSRFQSIGHVDYCLFSQHLLLLAEVTILSYPRSPFYAGSLQAHGVLDQAWDWLLQTQGMRLCVACGMC